MLCCVVVCIIVQYCDVLLVSCDVVYCDVMCCVVCVVLIVLCCLCCVYCAMYLCVFVCVCEMNGVD